MGMVTGLQKELSRGVLRDGRGIVNCNISRKGVYEE